MFIDTHAHLTFPEYSSDLPQVIERSKKAGLGAIIEVALDDSSIKRSLDISKEHKGFLGYTSRLGIIFIMIGFGASFGYTVMARVSLLIGRIQFLLGDWLGLIR